MHYQILVFITAGKNIKSSYNNNNFQISAPQWNDKFELPDGWHSVSDIQDNFEYILQKHGENNPYNNPSVQIYVKKKLKTGLHSKLKLDIVLNF